MTGRQGNAYSCGSRIFTGKQIKKKGLERTFPQQTIRPTHRPSQTDFQNHPPFKREIGSLPRKYAYSKKNDSKIKLEFFLFKTQCSLSCRPQSVHYDHSVLKYKQIAQGHKKCDEI